METLDYSIFPEKPVTYATFWNRFAAAILDALIFAALQFVVSLFWTENLVFRSVINILMGWLYYALQESGPNMATIGKRAMRIRVTDLRGDRITFGQATGRHFGKILSTIILFIGYFMMLWDDKCQTLHDKMAGTLVVAE